MTTVQVWTAPRCQSGAVCLGSLAPLLGGTVTESAAQSSVRLTVRLANARETGLVAGRWVWILHPIRGVTEWLVLDATARDSAGTMEVAAGTIRQALTLRGTIRTVNASGPVTTTFTPAPLPVAQLLALYFTPNAAADALEWVQVGTIAFTGAIQLPEIANWTRAQLLDEIERITGFVFTFTRLGDGGYQLDLVQDRAAGVTEVLLDGAILSAVEQSGDLAAFPTIVEPRASTGQPIGETWWTVAAISGSGPYWVGLRDDAGGPAVIREDDQANGWWLRPNDGVAVEITDSRASDSAVQVASIAGLMIGGLAGLWRTSEGAVSPSVSSPAALADLGPVVQALSVSVGTTNANRATDPSLSGGLASWQRIPGATPGGFDPFGRDDPKTVAMVLNGTVTAGATSLTVDGGPADDLIRFGDAIEVAGTNVAASAAVIPGISGGATVALSSPLPVDILTGTRINWARGGSPMKQVTANGLQSAGATSLVLSGLDAFAALTVGDTFVFSEPVSAVLQNGRPNPFTVTIPAGTGITVFEERLYFETPGVFGNIEVRPVSYAAVTLADAVPGAPVSFTPQALGTNELLARQEFRVEVASPAATYTVTGSPPAWAGDGTATAAITGTVGRSFALDTEFAWIRGGISLGTLYLTSARVSGDTTMPIRLQSTTRGVQAGDTFSVPSEMVYAGETMRLSGTGTGTFTLRAAIVAGISDNTALTVQRCRDYTDAELGSATVLRLRGINAVVPTTYLDPNITSLYSPVMRVRPLSVGSTLVFRAGFTSWAAVPSMRNRASICLWDVDTGVRLADASIDLNPVTHDIAYNVKTDNGYTASAAAVALTTTRRVRMSIHPWSGLDSSQRGAFLFLRYVAVAVVPTTEYNAGMASNFTPSFLVNGSGSNLLWHRAQDALALRATAARYRVQLGAVPPGTTFTLGGSVRVRSAALAVDTRARITRLSWDLLDADAVQLEIGAAPPRLTEST